MKILVDEETGERYEVAVKSMFCLKEKGSICAYITPLPPDCIYIFPTPVSKETLYQLEMSKWAKYSEGWCP